MSQYKIAVIVGSLRKESFNRKLSNALVKLAPSDFSFKELPIGDLPLYNQDNDGNPSNSVVQFKNEISKSQGVLFVTPEYNRSIPGVLKNALDNASRPYGQSAWAGKPAGLLGASIGGQGTAMAQQHLRNILAYLDMPTLALPEAFIHVSDKYFDEAGNMASPDNKAFLQRWMDRYVSWVKLQAK